VGQKGSPLIFANTLSTCENWLAVDKVIAKIIRLTFLAHPVYFNEIEIEEERACRKVTID